VRPVAFLPDARERAQAAATLRVFRATAFSGRSRERNARASRRKVTIAIRAIISGKFP